MAEKYGEARLKAILFGDDTLGTIMHEEAPHKNKDGVLLKRFLIRPQETLILQYPELQRPGALPIPTSRGPAVWKEYPVELIDDTNPSRTNAIVWVFCGFDGRPTTRSERTKKLTDDIMKLRIEVENLTISNVQLLEENARLQGQVMPYIKHIAEIKGLMKGEIHGDGTGEQNKPPI